VNQEQVVTATLRAADSDDEIARFDQISRQLERSMRPSKDVAASRRRAMTVTTSNLNPET